MHPFPMVHCHSQPERDFGATSDRAVRLATGARGSRGITACWLDSSAGPRRPRTRFDNSTRRLNPAHGNDERPQERHGAQPRRPALAGHLVPAPQARQGRRGRALQAEERRVRQDRRQDLQRRRQGRGRERRQADDAVPLQRRHVLRLHGHRHLRPGRDHARDRGRRLQLPPGEPGGDRGQQRRPRPLHRAPGLGRARGHLHRAGPPGRPLHRRHQARHRRDRRDRAVPLFITNGERIKVDTRDSSYLGRVQS